MKTNSPAYRHGSLFLASLALAASPLLAQTQSALATAAGNPLTAALNRAEQAAAPISVIAKVGLTQEGQHTAVRIDGNGRLKYHASRIQSPERLVLDFTAARLAVKRSAIASGIAPVHGIRMAQYTPEIARVVIDLGVAAPYSIQNEDKAVVVVFDASPATPVTGTSKGASEGGEAKPELRPVKFVVEQSRPMETRMRRTANVPTPKIQLPGELTQPSIQLASFGGNQQPLAPRTVQQTLAQQGSSQQVPAQPPAQQATPAPVQSQMPRSAQAATPAPSTGGRYTGEPISVNLKDVDLKDFFRLIHEISGLNVVLDPAVKGSLTIVLDEVPWDQALDIVLQNNNLDKQVTGNVLRVATRDTLKKEAETSRDLARAQSDAVDPVTWTKVLSYSKADLMRDTLKKFLSARGEILADARSNTIIIRDIPAVIPPIENLIRQLDRKSQQVEIEARVVSASRAFSRDLGVQLGVAGVSTGGRNVFGGNSAVGTSSLSGPPPTLPLPLLVNLAAGVATSGLTYAHRSPNFALDLFISAAEAKGIGKLLSKPKVITQNNEKAVVKQGTKIPIQTTINNTISVQFIDAVLRLEVTPQITAEGTVFMDVVVENTQIDPGIPRVQGIPALNTQSAETKVTVLDGGTVVIGGIIISQQNTDITEVPIIGSLPIIGHLFRRTNIKNSAQELLFFLTPRILPG